MNKVMSQTAKDLKLCRYTSDDMKEAFKKITHGCEDDVDVPLRALREFSPDRLARAIRNMKTTKKRKHLNNIKFNFYYKTLKNGTKNTNSQLK